MVFCNEHWGFSIVPRLKSHNPYFNRWFSAIPSHGFLKNPYHSHNPYFNRWFSAIMNMFKDLNNGSIVTILILIDGFLQYIVALETEDFISVTILILIDGFLQ